MSTRYRVFLIFTAVLDNELLCQKCTKNVTTVFVSEIIRVENYPDFEKLAHIIQHGLQGFIVKNIEAGSK